MNNRLKDFHTLMREADNAPRDTAAVLTVHAGAEDEDLVIEVDNSKPKEGFDNDDLESFYGLISQIKLNCYKLRQKTKDYEQAAEGMLGVMGREKIKKEQEDLNQIQEDASTIIHSTKDTFDKIQDMCQARSIDVSSEKLDDPEMDFKQPEDRMIVSAKLAAAKNWYDAVQEYTECDTRFSRQFRELHKRHYRELHDGADPTDEELDDQEGQRADVFTEVCLYMNHYPVAVVALFAMLIFMLQNFVAGNDFRGRQAHGSVNLLHGPPKRGDGEPAIRVSTGESGLVVSCTTISNPNQSTSTDSGLPPGNLISGSQSCVLPLPPSAAS